VAVAGAGVALSGAGRDGRAVGRLGHHRSQHQQVQGQGGPGQVQQVSARTDPPQEQVQEDQRMHALKKQVVWKIH